MNAREGRTGAGHVAGSRLVRWWQDGVPVEPPRQDFAERLSQWLGPVDAMTLRALQQSLQPVVPVGTARRRVADGPDLAALVQRARAAVQASIQSALAATGGPDAPPAPSPQTASPSDAEPAYAVYRQRHLTLQREMAASVTALRAQLRQALAQASPGLRQLATLDAVLEPMTAEREHKLWAAVPAQLAQRFEQARTAGGEPTGDGRGWRRRFAHEWTTALLAEWDARLEPVLGLLDAWRNEMGTER